MQDIIVFKCGGSSVNDLSDAFFDNIKTLKQAGMKPVVVHGGGPAIASMLEKLNIEFEFVEGLRKTTDEMMDIVEMVLSGHVNPALTRRFEESGIQTVGLSGSDRTLIEAAPIDAEKYGQVGEVVQVQTHLIELLIEQGIVPVISPVGIDNHKKRYNVNADTAAGAVASALEAKQLIFVTDVPGILKQDTLLENVTTEDIHTFIQDGTIYGGMIPKVKAAMKGLLGNVDEVMIVNGKHSEMKDTKTLVGTTIQQSK